ncbi:Transcription termination factor, mitochondrial/chloroplastic [Dillenia turbinata]|uniref:Transcription termination factor, mitochondrial/chloroplastic n=1 Tax=Dillenia turbinata TaxID=194707 RepID=A0AAN8UYG4_9MAGN
MEISSPRGSSIIWFFRDKGFDDKCIKEMFSKCKRLETVQRERASENWAYLKSIGIEERKIPSCLGTLGTRPSEVAATITKFPHMLSHSVEEKLCPLLAFFESLGVPEKQLGKMFLLNPRLISYSIETKLGQIVEFLASLGLNEEGMIGKVLAKSPYIMGYSVDKRLRPTSEFLKSLGLTELDKQRVAVNFPEVLCRDVEKILRPNLAYLKRSGFGDWRIVASVSGYPPILIKSIKNSLEPRIRFLVEIMGRQLDEVAVYPDFFRHALKKRIELRQKLLNQGKIDCSLSEMLDCNQKKFLLKFGLMEGLV